MGRWGDGGMVSHCVGRVPRLVASGATRRGRQGDKGTRRQGGRGGRGGDGKDLLHL